MTLSIPMRKNEYTAQERIRSKRLRVGIQVIDREGGVAIRALLQEEQFAYGRGKFEFGLVLDQEKAFGGKQLAVRQQVEQGQRERLTAASGVVGGIQIDQVEALPRFAQAGDEHLSLGAVQIDPGGSQLAQKAAKLLVAPSVRFVEGDLSATAARFQADLAGPGTQVQEDLVFQSGTEHGKDRLFEFGRGEADAGQGVMRGDLASSEMAGDDAQGIGLR